MRKITPIILLLLLVGCAAEQHEPYKAEWSSLTKHDTPQWLMDAKFGIYSHWGYQTATKTKPTGEMGMFEGFDLWKGEKFDAAAWAQLYKDAGAQFAGPLAQHGSGCLNWDSEISDWNSTNYGPKVDIVGELEPEIKKRGMKFMASYHSITHNGIWGQISRNNKKVLEAKDIRYDSINRNDTEWMEGWIDRVNESTRKYDIDLIWFDTSFGRTIGGDLNGYIDQGRYIQDHPKAKNLGGLHEEWQQRIIADYYNYGLESGRDVEVVYKSYDIPNNIGMRDIENGNLTGMQYDPWMTDISMLAKPNGRWGETWFWGEGQPIKSCNFIVDMLIDVTSKNGRMLLNVPPKVDGTFDDQIKRELYAIGDWLKVNGEGIYGSNPWCIYGEGDTVITDAGHHGQSRMDLAKQTHFNADDLRYTTKGRDIYAFALGRPVGGVTKFRALGSQQKLYPNEIKDVILLGSNQSVKWRHMDNYLEVEYPANMPESPAYCFKIVR